MEEAKQFSQLSLDSHASPDAFLDPLQQHQQKKKKKKKNKSRKNKNDAHYFSSSLSLHLLATSSPLPSQKHVEDVFPWKIVCRPRLGRCAISTRDIKAGDPVVSEQALAFVPRASFRAAACHFCCKDLSEAVPGVQCNKCKHVMFCEECKHTAASTHEIYCDIFSKIDKIAKEADCDADLLRLVLLLSLRRSKQLTDNEAGIIEQGILIPSFQDAMGLQTHREKVSAAWRTSVRSGCEALHDLLQNHVTNFNSTTEDMEYLAAMVNANAHGMGAQGLHNTDIAIGIFPFVSMMNHSCRPNCCFCSEGNVMVVRATEDIPKGRELCLSYINLYESRTTRREQLAATKYFDCHCARCMEPLSSSIDRFLEGVMCYMKGCNGVVVKRPQEGSIVPVDQSLELWQCDSCSCVLDPALHSSHDRPLMERPWDLVALANEKLFAAFSIYKERRFKDARVLLEGFISEFSGKLHPLHVLLFDALTPLMNCCRVLGDAEGGIRVCRNIINCLEKVVNGPSLEVANFYFCLGEMYTERANSSDLSSVLAKRYKRLAQDMFSQVRQMRKVCTGVASLVA